MIKQAVCNTVAFGRCRFKSCSADYMPQSLNWWRRCLEESWSGETRLAGSSPVCGVIYMETCANWQAACPEHR